MYCTLIDWNAAGCIIDLKSVNQSTQQPITDDETVLHKFCVKLETVLRHEQKGMACTNNQFFSCLKLF